MDPTSTKSWQALKSHQLTLADISLNSLFTDQSDRGKAFTLKAGPIYLDYSKNHITSQTMRHFTDLADDVDLRTRIQQLTSGAKINNTENRAALHTLLRTRKTMSGLTEEQEAINITLEKMSSLCQQLESGNWLGYDGRPIDTVVHIGIGGSFLGPRMVCEAMKREQPTHLNLHFLANVDGHHAAAIINNINPATTLVVIVSKTFTTQETMLNANTIKDYIQQSAQGADISNQLLGITANVSGAKEYGISSDLILPLWDFVGGRYSLWSAVGLPIALAFGFDAFERLLSGAALMDDHFINAEWEQNMPFLLAAIGIWYQNFWGVTNHTILPYDHFLRLLPAHLQQLDMESNGKSTSADGRKAPTRTGSVIWGSEGTNGQHAFHQLLHQGTQLITTDFILPLASSHPHQMHHDVLAAHCFAQSQALMLGRSKTDVLGRLSAEGLPDSEAELLASHKAMPGNRPSNTLLLEDLSPEVIGALIALYEHKVFVQAQVWGINPFDQWGVELGKELAGPIAAAITGDSDPGQLDSSTQHLVNLYCSSQADTGS